MYLRVKLLEAPAMGTGLLRLLPLLVGENDDAWVVILELKDIVELASSTFTDEGLCYLEAKSEQ